MQNWVSSGINNYSDLRVGRVGQICQRKDLVQRPDQDRVDVEIDAAVSGETTGRGELGGWVATVPRTAHVGCWMG